MVKEIARIMAVKWEKTVFKKTCFCILVVGKYVIVGQKIILR